jgi:hypothetical protein
MTSFTPDFRLLKGESECPLSGQRSDGPILASGNGLFDDHHPGFALLPAAQEEPNRNQ